MGTVTEPLTDEYLVATIADRVSKMPVLPHVVTRLLSLIGGGDHSLQTVVKIVETDASLTAQILRVANSAAFYRGRTVTTVSKAILHLGEKMVVGIAIGSCTSRVFDRPLDGYESERGELWDHSLRTAIAARETVALTSKAVSTDLAFTAGLLHDIGKSIISEFLNGSARDLTAECDGRQREDFVAAERHLIGTDHALVGYLLAQRWNLPEAISLAIRYHHRPSEADQEYRELVYVVHVADLLAMLGGMGTGADALSYTLDQGYADYLNLDKDGVPGVLLRIQEDFERTKAIVFPV